MPSHILAVSFRDANHASGMKQKIVLKSEKWRFLSCVIRTID